MNTQRTILVIEDNPVMLDNIVGILELAHYRVLKATSGKEGVTLAHDNHPDLIICDVMLPEIDGFGVLHLLRKDPTTAEIPFIFLSGRTHRSDIRKGMNLGADDYITKPFDGLELLNVVELRMKKKRHLNSQPVNATEGFNDFFQKIKGIKQFDELSDNCVHKKYSRREIIYMEGQQPVEVLLILSGQVKTVKTTEDGKELIIGFHGEGDLIGYRAVIENKKTEETAIVVEDTEVCTFKRQDFLTLLYTNNDVARKFIQLLVGNLHGAEQRLLELAYHSVRQKVAMALLKAAHRFGQGKNGSQQINLSRRDLANLTGTAIESLNRTIADFREQGVVEVKDTSILILDAPALERLTH